MKIIWRDWYPDASIAAMEKLGTVPWEEIDLDVKPWEAGDDVAAEIAEKIGLDDFERFRESTAIVIREPEQLAGVYDITVEYQPYFSASERL